MSRAGMMVASVIAMGLIGLGVWQMLPSDEEPEAATGVANEASPAASFQPPPASAVSVDAEAAHRGVLIKRITANGVAEAEKLINVGTEVAGTVDTVAVVEGQWVEAGDLLAAIDDTELVMTRDRAEEMYNKVIMDFANNQIDLPGAEVTTAQGDEGENALEFLSRYVNEQALRTMLRQPDLEERLSALTRADLFAAIAQLTNQRVALEQAELDLQRSRIFAPFGGQVAGLDATSGPNSKSWPVVGQRVGAGNDLMMLVDPDPIRVRVEVIESEISFVREGRGAEVTFPAYPGETFHGTIEAIDPLVDAARKTLSVTVRLSNADHRLKPGMFTQVVLDTEIFQDRLLVPVEAVLLRDNRQLVFVVRDGRAQWEYVTTGLENEEWIEVLSDNIEEGDVVVTSGHFTLAHDTRVTVAGPQGSEGGS
jgi:HlyD family secretion protein